MIQPRYISNGQHWRCYGGALEGVSRCFGKCSGTWHVACCPDHVARGSEKFRHAWHSEKERTKTQTKQSSNQRTKKTVLEELDQDASKKKNQQVPVSDLTYKHYRRSAAGGLNIKSKLREIFELDKKAFEKVPCFDMETGKCRLKLEQANLWTWPEMLDIAPECFDKLYLIKIYAFQIFAICFIDP